MYTGPIVTGPLPGNDLWNAMMEQAVDSTAYVTELLGDFLGNISIYFSWLPVEFLGVLLVGFGIIITFRILELVF